LSGDNDACLELLARAARRLNADDRLSLRRTDDFVVFAMDPEIFGRVGISPQSTCST
jgi:hypothetical protein